MMAVEHYIFLKGGNEYANRSWTYFRMATQLGRKV